MSDSSFSVEDKDKKNKEKTKRNIIIAVVVSIILLVIIAILVGVLYTRKLENEKIKQVLECSSKNGNFTRFVVASDSDLCSEIGCKLLLAGGNVIDAAIGTAFCTGVVNIHSTGMGGGGLMVYYDQERENPIFVDFQHRVPLGVDSEKYRDNVLNKRMGVSSVAVPSFIQGAYYIWQKYGKMEWRDVIKPVQTLLEDGFPFSSSTAKAIERDKEMIKDFPLLRNSLINPKTGKHYTAGETFKDPLMANTLKIIGESPSDFLHGDFGKRFFEELCENENKSECFLGDSDRLIYKVMETLPAARDVYNLIHYTANFPSSGLLSSFIIKVIEYSNITSFDKNDAQKYSSFLHRFIEAMRFGFTLNSYLGDLGCASEVENFAKSIAMLESDDFAKFVAEHLIDEGSTNASTEHYDLLDYGERRALEQGTSHLSVIDSEGNGVSITTSIVNYFGSMIRSPSTGIIYNNGMVGISSIEGTTNNGARGSKNNFAAPGKKTISPMMPTLLVDKETKKVILATGASGAFRIISATTEVILNIILGGMNIAEATDEARVHYQYSTNELILEENWPFNQNVLDILREKNHQFITSTSVGTVQTVSNYGGVLSGYSDPRKNGLPYGV